MKTLKLECDEYGISSTVELPSDVNMGGIVDAMKAVLVAHGYGALIDEFFKNQ
jgi:hypothetical protein